MNLQGGCLCGSVRYQCTQEAKMQFNCHCRDCQKSSGGAFSAEAFFRRDAVVITGEVKFFESKGGSGKSVWRGFCPNCGSQLFGKVEILPTLIAIRAGTLDDPSEFNPKANIYARHAPHWSHLDQDLVTFPENPPLR
jgi:hypothetical protein